MPRKTSPRQLITGLSLRVSVRVQQSSFWHDSYKYSYTKGSPWKETRLGSLEAGWPAAPQMAARCSTRSKHIPRISAWRALFLISYSIVTAASFPSKDVTGCERFNLVSDFTPLLLSTYTFTDTDALKRAVVLLSVLRGLSLYLHSLVKVLACFNSGRRHEALVSVSNTSRRRGGVTVLLYSYSTSTREAHC